MEVNMLEFITAVALSLSGQPVYYIQPDIIRVKNYGSGIKGRAKRMRQRGRIKVIRR